MAKKPAANNEIRHVIRYTLRIWFKHLWPYKKLIGLSMLAKLAANLASTIILPIIVGRIINHLASEPDIDESFIAEQILFIIGLLVTSIVFEYAWNWTCAYYLARARKNLESYVFKTLLQKSYRFYSGSFGGAIVSQFNRFIAAFQYFHDVILRELYSIVINLTATIIVTFILSPYIGLAMLLWTLMYVAIIGRISQKRYSNKRDGARSVSRATGYLADVLGNIMTIKIFARESYEQNRFNAIASAKMQAAESAWRSSGLTTALISALMAILNVSVLLISVYSIDKGLMNIGTLVLIQAFTVRITLQLWQLGNIIRDIDRSFADSSEMTEIITYQPDLIDPKKPKKIKISSGSISLQNVTFEYPDENSIPAFFKDLNIEIKSGERIGIVGPSGSGKTTIIKLILRLINPDKGGIYIDGHDIRTIGRAELRNAISYVPQEPLLFHRSLLDNIKYSNPDASMTQIKKAVKKARANIFIDRLPKGFDTQVGERGFKLSTGQRQRIAIARAMLKPSPILILDEATSAIDSESERLIQDALDELMGNRTTIVVAHRFSTIKKMDRIIFMSYGKIIEQGTHEELIKKKGPYAKLWAHQSGEFIEPEDFSR